MTHSDAKVGHSLTHRVGHSLTHSGHVYAGQGHALSMYLSHSLVTGAPAPEPPGTEQEGRGGSKVPGVAEYPLQVPVNIPLREGEGGSRARGGDAP